MANEPIKEAPRAAEKNPLIKTASEVAAMSNEEKARFRDAGGTATEDPQ